MFIDSAKKSISSENILKMMEVKKIIGHVYSIGHYMNMLDLLIGDSNNNSIN